MGAKSKTRSKLEFWKIIKFKIEKLYVVAADIGRSENSLGTFVFFQLPVLLALSDSIDCAHKSTSSVEEVKQRVGEEKSVQNGTINVEYCVVYCI